ncbi:MAG: prepilin-type N-terminal cleavage/methylation domain-containing protein [Patescibacteria group bacterium]|jgi:prepilin-type N-terminal cleavage/methylation domain-containing protein
MKKYRYNYFYTLVELLMAMAIFAIISVIMMRFFNSAQQIWSKASQKNALYADARVALDIMTAELQGALYDNNVGPSNVPGIYPFWFEYKKLNDSLSVDQLFANPPYVYNSAIQVQQATYSKAYVTQLNFISKTPFKPNTNASDICEIKYIYLPVRLDNKTDAYPTGIWNIYDNQAVPAAYQIKGGVLIRACTADLKSDGVTSNFHTPINPDYPYDFLLFPHTPAAATRVMDIFKKRSSEKYLPVVDGIVDMKITCYTLRLNGAVYELQAYNPMDNSGVIATNATDASLVDEVITTNIGTIISGTPFPVAVKIDLYMLAERDLHEWLTALNNSNPSLANLIKSERMRCFSKTIYLSSGK